MSIGLSARRRLECGLIAVVALGFVGCGPEALAYGIELYNDGREPVEISYVVNATDVPTGSISGNTIAPGQYKRFYFDATGKPGACTQGEIVARTEDGREVARIPPPVCFSDVLELSEYPPAEG